MFLNEFREDIILKTEIPLCFVNELGAGKVFYAEILYLINSAFAFFFKAMLCEFLSLRTKQPWLESGSYSLTCQGCK